MTFDRSALKEAKRIVVKVGTSTITYANGKRNFEQIDDNASISAVFPEPTGPATPIFTYDIPISSFLLYLLIASYNLFANFPHINF